MKPVALSLDFHAQARSRWLGATLLGLAILVTLATLEFKSNSDAQLQQVQDDLRRLDRAAHPDATRARASDPARDRALVRANKVLDTLTLPWEDLFSMFEGAGSNGLGLLGIVPDPGSHTVRISGEAKSLDEVISYVARLSNQPLLNQVHLSSYSTVTRDGVPAIEFLITAQWTNS